MPLDVNIGTASFTIQSHRSRNVSAICDLRSCSMLRTSSALGSMRSADVRSGGLSRARPPHSIEIQERSQEDLRVRHRIGECLLKTGLITQDDLQTALAEQERTGERLGMVMIRLHRATERQIAETLAAQLGFSFVDLSEHPP